MTLTQILRQRARSNHYKRYWSAVDRTSYSCPGCGKGASGIGDGFEVHHRDGDPLNGHVLNLVALCHHCHVRVHRQQNIHEHLEAWKSELPAHSRERASDFTQQHTVYVADGGSQ